MKSIVTVIYPAQSYDLTTVEDVMVILRKSYLTPEEEQAIEAYITSGSALISNYCNRVFPQEEVLETFWLDPDALNQHIGDWPREFWSGGYQGGREEKLRLNRYPIDSIISIYVDDVLVSPSEYRIDSDGGFVYRLDSSGYPWTWIFGKSILVNYVGGYDPIPADLSRAASLFSVDSLSSDAKDSLIKSETVYGIGSVTYFDGNMSSSSGGGGSSSIGDLSPRVMGMLNLYRRFPVG